MAATRLNEMLRWIPDVIERALAHQEPNAVRRAYTSAVEYWPERVELMQVWADYLDELKGSRPDAKPLANADTAKHATAGIVATSLIPN
jgi:hypothetical protein